MVNWQLDVQIYPLICLYQCLCTHMHTHISESAYLLCLQFMHSSCPSSTKHTLFEPLCLCSNFLLEYWLPYWQYWQILLKNPVLRDWHEVSPNFDCFIRHAAVFCIVFTSLCLLLNSRVLFRCFSLKALAYCRVLINASVQCFCHMAL